MHVDNFLSGNKIIHFYQIPDCTVDMDFVKKQLGKEYGLDQLIAIPFVKFFRLKYEGNKDQKFICSEFVGKALKLDWVDDSTTPKEIDEYLRGIYGNS